MFTYIFDGLNERYRNELEAVRAQHPFKDLRYARPSLRLTFQEGIQLLQEAGYDGTFVCFVYVLSLSTEEHRLNVRWLLVQRTLWRT